MVRNNNDLIEFKVHIIHWKDFSHLNNTRTVLVLCDEGVELVGVIYT